MEKRRIYDIVNVMEALDAMGKTNKSYYRWNGLESLPKLMAELQKEAVREHLPERVLRVEQAMCSFTELSPGSRKIGKDLVGKTYVSALSRLLLRVSICENKGDYHHIYKKDFSIFETYLMKCS